MFCLKFHKELLTIFTRLLSSNLDVFNKDFLAFDSWFDAIFRRRTINSLMDSKYSWNIRFSPTTDFNHICVYITFILFLNDLVSTYFNQFSTCERFNFTHCYLATILLFSSAFESLYDVWSFYQLNFSLFNLM